MNESSYSGIRSKLSDLNVTPSKRWGQNFLTNEGVAQEIANFVAVEEGDRIVEIGPGLGALTEKIYSKELIAVIEREQQFCFELAKKYPELKIINEDVRETDFTKLGAGLTIVGNLPYSLSTEILTHLIRQRGVIKKAIFLLQAEFAERMAASPGSKVFGSLTVFIQLVAKCELGPKFHGGSFYPKAEVDSRLIRLTFNSDREIPIQFEKFCKLMFSKRRKQIFTALKALGWASAESITEALEKLGVDKTERIEKLHPEVIFELYREIKGKV